MTSSINLPPLTSGTMGLTVKAMCAKPQMPPNDLSLSGQTAIITGSNAGIGLTCADMLLEHKLSHLIMAVRSQKKGEEAASKLRQTHPSANIEVWPLDMMSYDSIQQFVDRCATLPRIDFVILNAGIVKEHFQLSQYGHEESIQVNYLSTALLAILLLPVLKAKKFDGKARTLSIVNSGTSLMANFKEADKVPLLPAFDDETTFNNLERYPNSKILGQCFIIKLAEYVRKEDVVVNLVDPGLTKGTNLHTNLSGILKAFMGAAKGLTGRPLEKAASTYVNVAVVRGEETHGSFLMDWEISPFASMLYEPKGKAATERLWEETMEELEFAGVRSILRSMQAGSR
ncbi:Short chain dehydrogenase yanD [Colletotrichum fructicola]|nr:Short chain dehydrogenase yanD [Colletotrichum fructicola]